MTSSIATDSVTVHVPAFNLTMKPVRWSLLLDEARTPFIEAELTCVADEAMVQLVDPNRGGLEYPLGDPGGALFYSVYYLPPQFALELLDPRERLRVKVMLTRRQIVPTGDEVSRTFDLYLHARTLDAGEGTVTLVCRSDEALLIDDMLGGTEVDASAESVQSSLRAIIDSVLAVFDASLEPGTDDADFTLTEDGRDPDALKREPGERAWDFLDSLVQSAGLRLFCDEQRRWYLVDPAGYSVPGSLRISEGTNATAASDTIDLSAGDRGITGYAETIVVRYRWTDADKVQQVAYDAAGENHGVGRLIDVNRPFPGFGAAQAAYRKARGKGRTLALEALTDLAATPGKTLVATLPGAPVQAGVVSSVEFRDDGTMRVGSRGLTDAPETAWALQPDGYAWEDVPTGQSWDEYETPEV